jgi:farnesol dehydrogenase
MRVLVTGVSGFLGGRIARAIARRGHLVRGFVRDPSRWRDRPEPHEVARGDMSDPESVRRAAAGCEAIVHAAALVKAWARDRAAFERINVGGLRHVAEAASVSGARLLYCSSFLALGPTDGSVFHEDTPRAAEPFHNDYERTKWEAHVLARKLAAAGARIVSLYPGVAYGPGSLTSGNHVVEMLVRHARGRLPGLLGPADRRLSLAFVEDVAEGFASALERAPDGSCYILGGDNRTVSELFEAFARASGIPPPRRRIPYRVARFWGRLERWLAELTGREPVLTDEVVDIYEHEWAYSSDRAKRELGYRVTPLEEGIARTVSWLREIGEL